MRIRLDPHSFSLLDLDPDPGGKNLKNARQLVIIITYNFDQLHGFFFTYELSFLLFFSTVLHKVIFFTKFLKLYPDLH